MRMTAAGVVVFIATIAVNYYHLRVCVSVCVHTVTVRNHGKYGCDHCCRCVFSLLCSFCMLSVTLFIMTSNAHVVGYCF